MKNNLSIYLGGIVLIGLYFGYNAYNKYITKQIESNDNLVFSNIQALTEATDEPSASGKYINKAGTVPCVYTINYVEYNGFLIECEENPNGGPCTKGCIKR